MATFCRHLQHRDCSEFFFLFFFYQCALLHLSITLLHLLDGVFPLVNELLRLQVGLLQILCGLIQSKLFKDVG